MTTWDELQILAMIARLEALLIELRGLLQGLKTPFPQVGVEHWWRSAPGRYPPST